MRHNKDRAWNSFTENPSTENLNYATLKDKSYSEEEFRLKLEYEKRLTNDLKNNCKGLYSYLRNKRKLAFHHWRCVMVRELGLLPRVLRS